MFVKVHNKKSGINVLKNGMLNPRFTYTYQCNNSYSRFENGVFRMYSNTVGGYSGFAVEGIPNGKYVAKIKVKCIKHIVNTSLGAGTSTVLKPAYNNTRNLISSLIPTGIPLSGVTYDGLISPIINNGFFLFWIDTYGSYSEYEVTEIELMEIN